jgi:hypothetical protein
MKTTDGRWRVRRFVLGVAVAAAAVTAAFSQVAAAHSGGSWMLAMDVQLRVEQRGYELAICSGRGPYRIPFPTVERKNLLFRHFECFVNDPVGVVCVHTRPGKRLVLVARPVGHTCRF